MYNVEILPSAEQDFKNITYYITNNLNNSKYATKLVDRFEKELANIASFPHANAVYESISSLNKVYRRAKIDNYIIFYTIDYDKKLITITRILYYKQNSEKLLI